jgi:CheY-like chemotaxis protein
MFAVSEVLNMNSVVQMLVSVAFLIAVVVALLVFWKMLETFFKKNKNVMNENPSLNSAIRRVLLIENSDDDYASVLDAFRKIELGSPVCIYRCVSETESLSFLQEQKDAITAGDTDVVLPDVILLDLNLPGGGGCELLRVLKMDELVHNTPVVVLDTSMDKRNIDICYQIGASSYLEKPAEGESFVTPIREVYDSWLARPRHQRISIS